MKAKLNIPFFEIGVKNYIYGDDVLNIAKTADAAAKEYNIDVIFIAPYVEIRRVADDTDRLLVFSPYMDITRPGRGIADVLPEAIKAAGAKGVVINHSERPISLSRIKQTIDRANELDLISFVCADTIAEAQAIAHLHPNIINPEPSELIGSGKISDLDFAQKSINAIKDINPDIIIEQAAGISSGEHVYRYIYAGIEGVGASSGIMKAESPHLMVHEMIHNVRKAYDDRMNHTKGN